MGREFGVFVSVGIRFYNRLILRVVEVGEVDTGGCIIWVVWSFNVLNLDVNW